MSQRVAAGAAVLLAAALVWVGRSRSGAERGAELDAERLAAPGARARGERLFLQHCALCHGARADGRGPRRRYLSSPARDLTSRSWRERASAPRVHAAIRDGLPGTSMPAWRGLGAEALTDLTAFVLSVGGG